MTRFASVLASPCCIAMLVVLFVTGCGRSTVMSGHAEGGLDPVTRLDANHLKWLEFVPANVLRYRLDALTPEILADPDLASLATGFAVERPQMLDVGIYGKKGSQTVFVARRSKISDYDRLYWVMVRVLSEKYGCFIRKKTDSGQTVRFDCRDKRFVVLERDISGGFAKLSGRQFDASGREIVVKARSVARR
jgi:hypothetical protein